MSPAVAAAVGKLSPDWWAWWDERVSIVMEGEGLDEGKAAQFAYRCVVGEMRRRALRDAEAGGARG